MQETFDSVHELLTTGNKSAIAKNQGDSKRDVNSILTKMTDLPGPAYVRTQI